MYLHVYTYVYIFQVLFPDIFEIEVSWGLEQNMSSVLYTYEYI